MARISENLNDYINNSGIVEPHNAACEEVILGSILENNILFNSVAPLLNADDFYVGKNAIVYTAMLGVAASNKVLTPVILDEEIRKLGFQGGLEYLQNIKEKADSTTLESYTQIILEKSRQRKIAKILSKGNLEALKESSSSSQVFESVSNELFKLFSTTAMGEFSKVGEVGMSVLEMAQARADSGAGLSGLTTGYSELNRMLGGLHDEDFILVAARPSVGKTALGMGIARNAALLADIPVAIFSLEMSKSALVLRMLASEARVDSQKIQSGDMTPNEWKRVARALTTLSKTDIYLDDTALLSPMQLRAKARKLAFELMLKGKKLGLILVDYLQLMSSSERRENRQQEVSTISRELKAVNKEMKCPLMAMSQLNRSPEKREDPRPKTADLRDSGALEQDADVIAFIYREEQQQAMPTNCGQAEIIIAKQRMGPTGTVYLGFQSQFTRFENAFPQEIEKGFSLS
jgi:replicative DNA helicase